MAGGKETPRQKMIGMMYLVLTALLALNVTKEVVDAFVTINDKLDASSTIINSKIQDDYTAFDLKKMTIMAKKGNMTLFNTWNGKADSLEKETKELIHFLLSECNDMIRESEGEDWIAAEGRDVSGNIHTLKPLMDIKVKDNYDIPTQLFIGSNPLNPIDRGLELRNRIHVFRDKVTTLMANYTEGKHTWSFTPPVGTEGLTEALKTANPADTAKIGHFFRSLTIPEELYDSGEEMNVPWVSATFNHAPIVAAAAMFTSLKVDVKNAESIAAEFMLDKIDEPPYYINKIEPMAFARAGYINQGDSMLLSVLIAAYDSTEVNTIRYGMDEDTLPEHWTETKGGINLSGAEAGMHRLKGVIGVKERNEIVWKPWSFDYTVGYPMGVISQPMMRQLYRGYDNIIEAAASGFPSDKISISASSGCSISRGNNGQWIVEVGSGIRTATLTVKGEKEDGTIVIISSSTFEVKPLPRPDLFLGGIANGQNPGCSSVRSQNRVSLRYGPGIPLSNVRFDIIGGIVEVEGIMRKGKVRGDGTLDADAKAILGQACGKKVTITCQYTDPSQTVQNSSPLVFDVR